MRWFAINCERSGLTKHSDELTCSHPNTIRNYFNWNKFDCLKFHFVLVHFTMPPSKGSFIGLQRLRMYWHVEVPRTMTKWNSDSFQCISSRHCRSKKDKEQFFIWQRWIFEVHPEWEPTFQIPWCSFIGALSLFTVDNSPALCNDPGEVPNAVRSRAEGPYKLNYKVTYTCERCYAGGGRITCQSNGQWTDMPVCTGKWLIAKPTQKGVRG